MNDVIKTTILILFGAVALASCRKEFQFEFAENGPDMDINCASSAYLGGKITFSAELSDKTYPLSILKAQLFTDLDIAGGSQEPEAEFEVRTKEEGTYEGSLDVPYSVNVPDGNMAVIFTAVNTHLGYTYDTVYVAVSRPVFEYITLKTEDGAEYRMDRKEATSSPAIFSDSYWYAYTGSFGAECNAVIVTPEFEDVPSLTFGWGDSGIKLGSETPIPFSNGVAGEYEVSFNTYNLEAAPFVTLEINGTIAEMTAKDRYSAVLDLTQNCEVSITGYAPGFAEWAIDTDYFELIDPAGTFKFLPVDGKYKLTIEADNQFIRVEAMKNATELGTLNSDGTGALWLIGDITVGKPTMSHGASWNPEAGGLCLAQTSPGVYQITLIAGVQLSCDDVNFKFFHQKTWGGEFKFENISTDSELFRICGPDSDSGNIKLAEGKSLEMGGIYRFTVDLTGGTYADGSMSGAVLTVEKTGQMDIESEAISFAGVEMEMLSADSYAVTVDLVKGQTIEFSGIESPETWYMDPDWFAIEGTDLKFNAGDGKYHVTANTDKKFVTIKKVKEDGSDATLTEGALWLMGWGTAHPVMTSQFGWNPGAAYCMAEISPKVFQFTGIAVEESDGETFGGRFRYDYLSFKYFHQNGWGGEKGTVTFTDSAKAILKDANNLELTDGVTLEKGATYVLTIDLSVDGVETVDFIKK